MRLALSRDEDGRRLSSTAQPLLAPKLASRAISSAAARAVHRAVHDTPRGGRADAGPASCGPAAEGAPAAGTASGSSIGSRVGVYRGASDGDAIGLARARGLTSFGSLADGLAPPAVQEDERPRSASGSVIVAAPWGTQQDLADCADVGIECFGVSDSLLPRQELEAHANHTMFYRRGAAASTGVSRARSAPNIRRLRHTAARHEAGILAGLSPREIRCMGRDVSAENMRLRGDQASLKEHGRLSEANLQRAAHQDRRPLSPRGGHGLNLATLALSPSGSATPEKLHAGRSALKLAAALATSAAASTAATPTTPTKSVAALSDVSRYGDSGRPSSK